MTRVLITAGAAGLGRAMAEGCLDRGDRVAVCDVDAQAVAEFAKANPDAIAQVVDVTDETGMARFLDHVEQVFGGIDVVCANAGTGGPAGRIETLDLDAWRDCIDVNLTGAFLTCRWAARLMRAQNSGVIVLTSSTAGGCSDILCVRPMRPRNGPSWV